MGNVIKMSYLYYLMNIQCGGTMNVQNATVGRIDPVNGVAMTKQPSHVSMDERDNRVVGQDCPK